MSLYNQENLDMAMEEFQMLSNHPETKFGAEAYYRIAETYFKQGKYDKVETTVFDFVKTNTPQQYWLGKAFLLLADVYYKNDNPAQAKATLKSIIDNYKVDDDGIKDEAKQKLEQIEQEEKHKNTEQEEEFNIDYSKENNKIFDQNNGNTEDNTNYEEDQNN
jgi:outer membrane protein assembly factor BamD (BamD/ComL family)